MGLLTFGINVTLDGCVDHREGIADDETHAFFTRLMDEGGAMLWGRTTYELMESYWPAVARGEAEAPPAIREWAAKLEAKPKFVVSSTRKDFPWTNSHHIAGDLGSGVQKLKDETPDGVRVSLLGRTRLAHQRLLASILACMVLLFAGCATTNSTDGRPAQRPRIEPPTQPADSLRLIIYRPQVLVGMSGRPVVVVNGRKMLTVLGESMLDPGSVFVVDVPAAHAKVNWIQSRKTEPDVDALAFNGAPGATRYLRWTLKPTYGYLEQVPEAKAHEELAPLQYMGYRNMVDAK